jgi:hypothetical protein
MKFPIIMSTILLMGCAGGYEIAIEDEFTEHEKVLIYRAIDEWIEATDSESAWVFTREGYHSGHEFSWAKDWAGGPDFAVLHRIHTYESGYKVLRDSLGNDLNGVALESHRIAIVIDNNDTYADFYRTILHELGHFHSLDHEADGLMYSGSQIRGCIDEVALGAFCDTHGDCGSNRHSTCE